MTSPSADLRSRLQITLGSDYSIEHELGGGMSRVFRAHDSTLADAYVAQGCGLIARWDWDGSEMSFHRTLALEPLNPEAHHWHADLLYALGDIDGALNEQRRSQQLDPTSAIVVAEIATRRWTHSRQRSDWMVVDRTSRGSACEPAIRAAAITRSRCNEEAPASWGVSCEPVFDPLKSDPRFGVLMARMNVHVCPPGPG